MRLGLVLLALCGLVSCELNKNNNVTVSQDASAIINGHVLKETDPLAASIVAVWDGDNGYICTGSLMENNIVITAAHCVSGKPSRLKIIFDLEPYTILDAREPDVIVEHVRRVVDGRVHENYIDEETQGQLDINDIAVLKFEGSVPAGYRPAQLLADAHALSRGTPVTVAGYGVDDVDIEPIDPRKMSRKKLEEGIESGEIICDGKLTSCFMVEMTGDGVLRATEAPVAAVYDTEVRLDERHHGTCSGDSGGPAYVKSNGSYYLFGVTSRGNGMCNQTGIYTNILSHKDWYEKAIRSL